MTIVQELDSFFQYCRDQDAHCDEAWNKFYAIRGKLLEKRGLYDNLTATQERCTELLEENRQLRARIDFMRVRWLDLLTSNCWEPGPEDDSIMLDYSRRYRTKDGQTLVIIERTQWVNSEGENAAI